MKPVNRKVAVIAGAGPAGLTAAYELLTRTEVVPVVLEMDNCVGGISRTVNHNGNRIDIGGHRFFSKSDRVMDWWLSMMALENGEHGSFEIAYQNQKRTIDSGEKSGGEMLVRNRKSRIYFRRSLLDYPLSLNADLLRVLGLRDSIAIGLSYLYSTVFPRRPESSLEDFLINRFGRKLYLLFFKSYTEKVWGKACHEIDASWGRQRIKGLSIWKTVFNAATKPFRRNQLDLQQKGTETSLIERFLYPKHGPGQLWQKCHEKVNQLGGEVRLRHRVVGLHICNRSVVAVTVENLDTGGRQELNCDYFLSSMPVSELIASCSEVPCEVREIARQLEFRDFITVGLLIDSEVCASKISCLPDNWIYVQESDVSVGRIQIFNNWSPGMVADPKKTWIGLEYFCNEGDALWNKTDAEIIKLASTEIEKLALAEEKLVVDACVVRMPKAYPSYTGAYGEFPLIRQFLDSICNLFPIGRNGMHRYNNQDHSMLTAMIVVDLISSGKRDKFRVWDVNAEEEYHETRTSKS